MKTKYLLLATLIIVNCQLIIDDCFGQNIAINATGNPANSSAGLDIDFTNKGFLLPRMTTAQRNAIVSPALGLQIFNTSTNCFEAYIGTTWQSIYCGCTSPSAPTANAASGIAQTSFTANWTTSAGATAYYLDVNTNSAFTGTWILNNVNVGNVTSYSVTGLTCATTYYYRVRANNSCGTSGNSNIITVTTSSCVCVPGANTATFNYTGGSQTWPVPGGIFCITVDVRGASGGTGSGIGGNGGRAVATIAVTPGEILNVYVGGAGAGNAVYNTPGGWNGGGGFNDGSSAAAGTGGGASDVRRTPYGLVDRLIVAGGGGGHAYSAEAGGNGGGLIGSDGQPYPSWPNSGGKGGTQTAGGAAGIACCQTPTAGSFGQGGLGDGDGAGGGGGGGGYYGGGGGLFGGGGGGSGYADPAATGVTHTSGFQSGNGQIIITY